MWNMVHIHYIIRLVVISLWLYILNIQAVYVFLCISAPIGGIFMKIHIWDTTVGDDFIGLCNKKRFLSSLVLFSVVVVLWMFF